METSPFAEHLAMALSTRVKSTRRIAAREDRRLAHSDPDKITDLRAVLAMNLRRLREERQLSQADLADKAGVNRTYLVQLEFCIYFAGVRVIELLALALGVEPFVLLKPPNRRKSRRH